MKKVKEENKNIPQRSRLFATIVYPDSAPKDWLEILRSEYIPSFVIKHDKDFNNGDGEIKKEHYHIFLMFDGVKTKDQVKEIFDKIGGVGFEYIQSKRGYARYLCHLDNPEKYQYKPEDVICLAGSDYYDAISRESDKYKTIKQIIEFVRRNHIISYTELFNYCMDFEDEWFRALCDSSSYVVSLYIKENRLQECSRY